MRKRIAHRNHRGALLALTLCCLSFMILCNTGKASGQQGSPDPIRVGPFVTDQGATWAAVNNGITSQFVNVLAIDRQSPETIYAGTSGGVRPSDAPWINTLFIDGKKLVIRGQYFDEKAVILLNGQEQKTKNDETEPAFLLISKKGGKKIKKDPATTIQIRNSNGKLSQELIIWPPIK